MELLNLLRRLSLSQAIKVDTEIKNSTGIARKDMVTGSPVGVATAEKINVVKTTRRHLLIMELASSKSIKLRTTMNKGVRKLTPNTITILKKNIYQLEHNFQHLEG